jgi:3,4-dihydroxy 2-butanone 4-phosphate synthase / GTP cyclohydrolase II
MFSDRCAAARRNELHAALKKIQEAGACPVDAASESNTGIDLRIYGIGAQILRALGARKIRLLTNHPKHIVGLQGYGITVVDQVHL